MNEIKQKAQEHLATELAKIHRMAGSYSGAGLLSRESLEQPIRRIRELLKNYVVIGLFTQEEHDDYWALVNSARAAHKMRELINDLSKFHDSHQISNIKKDGLVLKDTIHKLNCEAQTTRYLGKPDEDLKRWLA